MATADLLQAMRKQAKPTAVNLSPTEDPVPDGGGETAVPPSRVGKRQVAAYFPVPVQRQLKLLTIEKDTTIQGLLAEALNDLFAKYGKPEIAPTAGPGR